MPDVPRVGGERSRVALGRGLRLTRRLLEAVTLVALVLVVAAFAVFAVPQAVGAEHSYVVLSGSMQPAMEPGDVILVDAVDIDDIRVGDVVSFRDETGTVTTHRVADVFVGEDGRHLWTKGDDNEERDPGVVTEAALVGRVMTVGDTLVVIPYIGLVVEAAGSDLGAYLLLFVPLTLLVLNEVYTRLGRRTADDTGATDPLATGAPAGADGDLPPGLLAHLDAEGATDLLNGSVTGRSDAARGSADIGGDPGTPVGTGLSPADVSLSIVVLGVLTAYSGWVAWTLTSVIAAMVVAACAVGVVLLAGVRIALYRRGVGFRAPAGGLHRTDLLLTTPLVAVLVLFSGWMAVSAPSGLASTVFAGAAVSALLLAGVQISLWRAARRRRRADRGDASRSEPREEPVTDGGERR